MKPSILDGLKQALLKALRDIGILRAKQHTMPPALPPDLPPEPPALVLEWDTEAKATHSARVIMDEYGLTWPEKGILCAIIKQESNWNPKAVSKPNTNGTQDYGLVQVNNGKNVQGVPYWIGPGAIFHDVAEVLDNPEKNVRMLVEQYKLGNLKYWSSYNSGAYKQWLNRYV